MASWVYLHSITISSIDTLLEIEPMDLYVLMKCSPTDPHSWPFLKSYLYFDISSSLVVQDDLNLPFLSLPPSKGLD